MDAVRKLVQYARNDTARHERDIPKRQRPRRVIEPTKPFTGDLGHPPRPRKRGRRTVGGYESSGRPADDLARPPKGPAPGAQNGPT